MGTSGAYGGSNTQPWRDVHDAFGEMPPGPGPGDAGDGDGDGADGDSGDSAAGLAGAISNALGSDDGGVSAPAPASPYALGSLIARGPGGGGGGGGGGASRPGGLRGESGGTGRSGGGSSRSIGRSAARGGAAIGGAYALRAGDATALADLGLDLDHLRTLSPRAQCARILDAVLGEGGHPDEAALRAAAVEQMKAVLSEPTAPPPAEGDALRAFIASYVFQLALVELRSGLERKDIDVPEAALREGQLLRYLKKRVEQLSVPARGRMPIQQFAQHADRLVREMLKMLRDR